VPGCRRCGSCCRILLLGLLIVELDGQRDRPAPQPHQENLNLTIDLGLLLPPHCVIGKHGPVGAGGRRRFITKRETSAGIFEAAENKLRI